MAKKVKKYPSINIRVSDELKATLEKRAATAERSLSDYCKKILEKSK